MITRIREVRRARGLTLDDVARHCEPPTTPQTIGRLETGTRTVSVGWLNRIAKALGVEAQDLVEGGECGRAQGGRGPWPGRSTRSDEIAIVVPPRVDDGQIAVLVAASVGDYRSGDEIWCELLASGRLWPRAKPRRSVPRPAGRFLFGRLINRDDEKLQILPLEAGGRQQVVANPPWLASRPSS